MPRLAEREPRRRAIYSGIRSLECSRIPRCLDKCSASAGNSDFETSPVFPVISCSLYIIFNYCQSFHYPLQPITTLFLSSFLDCEGSAPTQNRHSTRPGQILLTCCSSP